MYGATAVRPPDEFLWTIAAARLVLDPAIHLQAPPNLSSRRPRRAGRRRHRRLGRRLAGHPRSREPRAAVARARRAARRHRGRRARRSRRASPCTPSTCATRAAGCTPTCGSRCSCASDSEGLARDDAWAAGGDVAPPRHSCRVRCPARRRAPVRRSGEVLDGVLAGEEVGVDEIVTLLEARGPEVARGRRGRRPAAPRHRRRRRHLRAQPQHQLHERLHVQVQVLRVLEGPAVAEPARRPVPARSRRDPAAGRRGGRVRRHRGLPAGRDPSRLRRRLLPRRGAGGEGGRARDPRARLHRARGHRRRAPARHAARATTSRSAKDAGLATLPGTAAEILDDEVRAIICPDKIDTEEWLEAHRTAHSVGLRSNVTIMFGHVERPVHVARHLVRTRALQKETGGFTEFVPLPFVHMATPIYLQQQGAPRPDDPRGPAHARGRAHRLPRLDRQHPGLVGEDRLAARARRCRRGATTSAAR